MASLLVTDIYAKQEIEKIKKTNEKLLYLLNKYRFAYLKSLELILFYEKILKKNFEKKEDQDLNQLLKKKRQNESVFEEEQFLRKKFKTDIFCGTSVDIIPYNEERNTKNEHTNYNVEKKEIPNKKNAVNDEKINEPNKEDYINLDALDFSAYAEDAEGCIKYCEKANEIEKEPTNKQNKHIKESNIMKSTYNKSNLEKKMSFATQSKYGKSIIKNTSTHSRILPSTYNKNILNDMQTKEQNISLKPNLMNKSVYQKSVKKELEVHKKPIVKNIPPDKKDFNKSLYVSNATSRNIPSTNKSVYIGSKIMPTRTTNTNDSIYISSQFMINKNNPMMSDKSVTSAFNKNPLKQKINETVKKAVPLNKYNSIQSSTYSKNTKMANVDSQIVHMNLNNMPSKNLGKESNSMTYLNSKVKGISNETKGYIGIKPKIENNPNWKKDSDIQVNDSISMVQNTKLTEQKEITLKKNIMNEEKENLIKQLQVKNEQSDEEKKKEKKVEVIETMNKANYAFLPLTMNYIDSLIENEENNKKEKEQRTDQYVIPLKNEENEKKEKNIKESNQFTLNDLTEEEYNWIVESRETKKKTNKCIKKELKDDHSNKNIVEYENNKEETQIKTQENEIEKIQIDKSLDNEKHMRVTDSHNIGREIEKKEMQKNELLFSSEKGTVRSFRIGKTSGFGKLKDNINESSYSTNLTGSENMLNLSKIKNNTNEQAAEETEINDNSDIRKINMEKNKEKDVNVLIHIKEEKESDDLKKNIMNINKEIIQKKNLENTNENTKETNKTILQEKETILLNTDIDSLVARNSKPPHLKNIPFLPPPPNNALLKKEKVTTKTISNNRANFYIELNTNFEFMSLDNMDVDKAINEGLLSFKNVEDSYIECSAKIKDMVIYNNIMKMEKKTYYFSTRETEEEREHKNTEETQNKIEVVFKTAEEIKKEVLKIVGVSIFQNINVTLHPTKSLINDKKLVMWFTKKKREKGNKNIHCIESDSSQSTWLKKKKHRLSSMGMFSQPLIIMISSLKRQNIHTSLKKIIKSLVICSCDSSSLEKIVHILPEENSKNYTQWKECLYNLDIFIGDRKIKIIKKLVEIHKDNSDDETTEIKKLTQNEDEEEEEEEERSMNESFNGFSIHHKNKLDPYHLHNYDHMKKINYSDNCISNSLASSTTTTTTSSYNNNYNIEGDSDKKKQESIIYEDEEFCLFIGTIPNAHKRFQYLLLVDNFDFIYEDLTTHIKNKLNSIELIINKHAQLKQLFCNVLYLCNWLNEPKYYKWFLWNDILKRIDKLCGYLENGRISRERNIMLLLAEHTGHIFTDKELNNLKKISKFHIKDLYDKAIDFINSYFELKNQMNSTELKKMCCVSIDGINVLPEDKFLEKIKYFVEHNYKRMLYIVWNLDLMIKKYLILIVWLGDIKPFYPLFSYIDEKKKIIYSHDLFVNIVLFFETYNKYVTVVKKKNESEFPTEKKTLKNEENKFNENSTFTMNIFADMEEDVMNNCNTKERNGSLDPTSKVVAEKYRWNKLNYENAQDTLSCHIEKQNAHDSATSISGLGKRVKLSEKESDVTVTYKNNQEKLKHIENSENLLDAKNEFTNFNFPELKKRKSLTNTVNYACEIKRKSLEQEQSAWSRRKSSSTGSSVEFEKSD